MAEIGRLNDLRVVKEVDFGLYLDGDDLGEILLPLRDVPEGCCVDDIIRVFIYRDSEDRLIASRQMPYAMVGEFALLKVVAVNPTGAFLDWGLQKDLMVPFREQNIRMKTGQSYLVRVYLDASGRIAASAKLDRYLDNQASYFQLCQEVDLMICTKSDLGHKAIINGTHWGLIHFDDLFQGVSKGEQITGFIKKIRDDGKIDLCLTKPGYEKIDGISKTIIDALKKQGGRIQVTDKSPPETIQTLFGISKKNYKKAIGSLYKKRLITIEPDEIRLK
jgi:uncharacterized protein